ncbi:MAG: DUF1416 domain-containing protein [Streptosporangiaceae bacterium]
MTATSGDGCGAPAGGVTVTAAEAGNQAIIHGNQAIIQGHVTRSGAAVSVGYARLLNSGGEFVAEVPLGGDGGFRFFAAPGSWTLRILAPDGVREERTVSAATGQVAEVEVAV